VPDSCVNKDVTGACIEVEEVLIEFPISIGWNEAYVGNTSNVLACPEFGGMMEEVNRRSLSAVRLAFQQLGPKRGSP